MARRVDGPPTLRFWAKVEGRDHEECWTWQGCRTRGGYGHFRGAAGKMVMAHRFSYEDMIAPVPEGLELDHLCMNTACVNPYHLDPVPRLVNMRRRYERQTHCKWGHEFTEENTWIVGVRAGRPHRRCKVCARARARVHYRKTRRANA